LRKSFIIVIVSLFTSGALCMGASQDTGLLSRVIKNYSGDVSLSTTFDVKIVWKVREKEETKHGSIVLGPGDHFRIGLGESMWVCDGATLWQYDKSPSPQVIVRKLASCDPLQLPSRLLSKYLTRYSFTKQGTTQNGTVFSWSADTAADPQKGEARRISFTVDPKRSVVKELSIIDKSGNESAYTFRAASFRASKASVFSFDIPKGARVIDER
jgi:outer membrane lipoprotein-sorting protein